MLACREIKNYTSYVRLQDVCSLLRVPDVPCTYSMQQVLATYIPYRRLGAETSKAGREEKVPNWVRTMYCVGLQPYNYSHLV